MLHADAFRIAQHFLHQLEPFCEPDGCKIAGGLRRGKSSVHDIEFVLKPIMKAPRPVFGEKPSKSIKTMLDHKLFEMGRSSTGDIYFKNGADRNKKYWIDLAKFDMEPDREFILDVWITLPPAQFGVNYLIRTGPGSPTDHFSKWVVTQRSEGGALPDGYRVKHCAVWRVDQLDAKDKPFEGECPLLMPTEEAFLDFLGLPDLEPSERHADWGRYIR